nr:hypothetical protein [Tanacetum cinerariifolium]
EFFVELLWIFVRDKMSRDVITVGSTMRIPLLYRDKKAAILYEYETFEAIEREQLLDTYLCYLQLINDLKKCGYKKDNSESNYKFLNNLQQEWKQYATLMRKTKNLMDINIDAFYNILKQNQRDMNDALGYKKKATYLCYLQLINDLKKCGYKKDNSESNYKFLNNLQQEWKQYATLMRKTKNLMDINIDAFYNILKQNQRDMNDALGYKKKAVMVTSDPLALVAEKTNVSKQKEKVVVSSNSEGSDDKKVEKKADEKKRDLSKVKCYNCKKEGHFAKECKKAKIKDYNYYKTKMLLAKKDSDEEVLLVVDQAWLESISDSDQEINANMVFMAQIEK